MRCLAVQDRKEKTSFFNWFYFFVNIGSLLAVTGGWVGWGRVGGCVFLGGGGGHMLDTCVQVACTSSGNTVD